MTETIRLTTQLRPIRCWEAFYVRQVVSLGKQNTKKLDRLLYVKIFINSSIKRCSVTKGFLIPKKKILSVGQNWSDNIACTCQWCVSFLRTLSSKRKNKREKKESSRTNGKSSAKVPFVGQLWILIIQRKIAIKVFFSLIFLPFNLTFYNSFFIVSL